MAKLDLKCAYRMVPVHPADRWLLGIRWCDAIYCEFALPFGLRSTLIIFNSIADALTWAIISRGIVNVIHYLDDFLIWSEDASRYARDLQLALSICSQLGLPAEPSKVEGPDTTIEIDSLKEELRLPQSKLVALKQLLASWSSKWKQVLLGHLNHSAMHSGKSFLRHLINAISQLRQQSHLTRLNTLCRSDIICWLSFVERWNGINFFSMPTT